MRAAGSAGAPERLLVAGAGGLVAALGLSRRSVAGAAAAAAAATVAYRAVTGDARVDRLLGFSPPRDGAGPIAVERSVRVARPAEELYAFWRDPSNHQRFSKGLRSAEALDERRSRWTAETVGGRTLTWEAEVVEERAPELIRWRSLPGGDLQHDGRVEFRPAPHEETEVRLALDISDPPGPVGGAVAALLAGEAANRRATEELRRFKQLMEAGEIATVAGQPAGERTRLGRALSATREGRDRR